MNPVLPVFLPLLQTRYQFLARPNARSIWIFVGLAAVFVVLLVVGGILGARRNRARASENGRRYSRGAFRRAARDVGLQKQHVEALEELLRVTRVKQPFMVFSSPGLLDDLLRRGVYSLEANTALTEEQRERRKGTFFQIKQIIERNARRGGVIKSTTALKPGQMLAVRLQESGPQYRTRVVSNMRDMMAVAAPENESGQRVRWPKGTRLKVNLWRDTDAGYAFDTKVLAYDTIRGTPCLLLQHSKTVKREQLRRYRRTTIHRSCFFYPIRITSVPEKGRMVRKAMVLNNRRHLGNLIDISAGGCSLGTLNALEPGSLCKLEFEMSRRDRITVFGKVRRTRRTQERGAVMHVMFTKLSARHLNQIYSYVYDLNPARLPVASPG